MNRRDFLKTLTKAAGIVALTPSLLAQATPYKEGLKWRVSATILATGAVTGGGRLYSKAPTLRAMARANEVAHAGKFFGRFDRGAGEFPDLCDADFKVDEFYYTEQDKATARYGFVHAHITVLNTARSRAALAMTQAHPEKIVIKFRPVVACTEGSTRLDVSGVDGIEITSMGEFSFVSVDGLPAAEANPIIHPRMDAFRVNEYLDICHRPPTIWQRNADAGELVGPVV